MKNWKNLDSWATQVQLAKRQESDQLRCRLFFRWARQESVLRQQSIIFASKRAQPSQPDTVSSSSLIEASMPKNHLYLRCWQLLLFIITWFVREHARKLV